jgi:hypothetical protein
MVSGTVGWAVGDGGTVYKTVDGGATWTGGVANLGIAGHPDLWDVAPLSASVLYAVGAVDTGTSYIGKSLDGGATWTRQATALTIILKSIDAVADNAIASGPLGAAYTIDGGTTWTASGPVATQFPAACAAGRSRLVIGNVAGAPGGLLYSDDDGATLSDCSFSYAVGMALAKSKGTSRAYAASSKQAAASKDGGATWTLHPTPVAQFSCLSFATGYITIGPSLVLEVA